MLASGNVLQPVELIILSVQERRAGGGVDGMLVELLPLVCFHKQSVNDTSYRQRCEEVCLILILSVTQWEVNQFP